MSYTVIRRTREIGIRMAVGAGRGDVVWMVLRTTLALAAAGLALGIPLVVSDGPVRRERSSSVCSAAIPCSIGAGLLVLLAVAIASGAWPAWRASRLDPMVSLRQE